MPNGIAHYVIEDDYPKFLADHPKLDPEDGKQVYVYRGEDRLLTLTGQEAVSLGMATGFANDKAELLDKLGIDEANVMDLTPRGIRQHLGLNKPIYERTAAYGHFGRDPEADGGFSWERTDLVDALKKAV